MTKEEILKKSRNENQNADVYDLEVQKSAVKIAFITGLLLILVISAVIFIVKHEFCAELYMLFAGMETVLFGYKYAKMKKKHELMVTLLYGTGFIFFAFLVVKSLIA